MIGTHSVTLTPDPGVPVWSAPIASNPDMTVTQPSGDDQSKAREQVVRETYQTVKRL